jgi:hypothetical protein
MDPYLEHPAHWRGVHTTLIVAIQKLLTPILRPRYTAWVEERVYLAPDNDPAVEQERIPDLRINRTRKPGRKRSAAGGLAVVEPVVVTTLREEEIRERHLEVRATDTRDLVAVIEVVSPSNKVPGSAGSASFTAKRREVTGSPAHWVEIDLLRQGSTLDVRKRLAPHEYCVHVSPADLRPTGRVWPIRLVEPLPVIDIPLRATDSPAPLDLRAALDVVYDDGGYDLKLDYRNTPVPPLSPELAAWADALLRKKKLR